MLLTGPLALTFAEFYKNTRQLSCGSRTIESNKDNQQRYALVMVKIKSVLVDYLVPCFRCRNDWVLMESNPSFLIDDDGELGMAAVINHWP